MSTAGSRASPARHGGRAARAEESTASSRDAPLRVGAVTLIVRNLDAMRLFYLDTIGLGVVREVPGGVDLGVGRAPLLRLRCDPNAAPDHPGNAGLFHTAFLLPSRADLARWLAHAIERQVRLDGASDHSVSEAIYLADPEGNGIEVYADRPRTSWLWSAGMVTMATEPLDVADLLSSATDGRWSGAPDQTCVGHVHLRVGAIDAAERFYGGVLGLNITRRRPGATFYSSGGYHHHVATNIWRSEGAPPRSSSTAGLGGFEIVAAETSAWDALEHRLRAAGLAGEGSPDAVSIEDPWRNRIFLRRRVAGSEDN